ncbi:unnamed protein product [Amoebophrya sp. A120]|nr:unnamed protein product [Amoebophrya sp. A120]|eukprot:GSA120T00003900001.1
MMDPPPEQNRVPGGTHMQSVEAFVNPSPLQRDHQPSRSSSSSKYKETKRVDASDFGKSVASGAVSGFAVKTLTAPLSRMTILLQVTPPTAAGVPRGAATCATGKQLPTSPILTGTNPSSSSTSGLNKPTSVKLGPATSAGTTIVQQKPGSTTNFVPTGSLDLLRKVVQQEGVTSFWKGNWTSILHKGLLTGLNYGLFETIKNSLRPIWRSDTDPGFLARTAAGFLASSVSLTIAYPFDLMRTRLACEQRNYHLSVPTGQQWLGVYRDVVKTEGPRALVRGLPCTLLCQGLNVGLNFGIYETLNVYLLREQHTRTTFLETMGCGAVAGITASTLVQPLDLIRRRQQMSNESWTVLQWGRHVVQSHGLRGLYRGLVPELLKVAPAVGLNFYIYEWMRQEVFQTKVHPR